MYKSIVLKNGLTIIKILQPASHTTVIGFLASSGSANEELQFPQGISNLISRLFWRGTDKHPSVQSLNLALENLGGVFTIDVTQETSEFYIKVPHYHQYRAISLLTEIIHRSYFDALDIEREKLTLIDELKESSDVFLPVSPNPILQNLYINSSLGLPIHGTVESIMQIDEGIVKKYLDHQYQPKKAYIIISGNFEEKGVAELLEQEWMFWNPRNRKFIESENLESHNVGVLPRLTYRQKGSAFTQLSIGFVLDRGIQFIPSSELQEGSDPQDSKHDYLAEFARILVLNTLLGRGMTSKLWSRCVDEELLFGHIQSDIFRYNQTGFLQISGLTDNIQFSFALESVFIVLESLKKTTVSITELLKAKEYIKGELVRVHEDTLIFTKWYTTNVLRSGINFSLQDLLERIDKVEAPTVRSLALDLFKGERLVITTIGTAKETKVVDKLIQKYL